MTSKNETIEIVEKLIELTQHNSITWRSSSAPRYLNDPNSRVDLVFCASYVNQNLRVYQKHFKYYFDELNYVWDENVVFEIVDSEGYTLFVFPNTPNSYGLLNAIRYQTSNVRNFYNELLNKQS